MSQQLIQQQWTYQLRPSAKATAESARGGDRPKAVPSGLEAVARWQHLRSRLHFSPDTSRHVILLTAFLLALAVIYVYANALATGAEYRRQRLQRATDLLRRENVTLRWQLGQAADLAQVRHFAQTVGMRPADPASESDFLVLAPTNPMSQAINHAWFDQGPLLAALLAHQLSAPGSIGRAEASPPRFGPAPPQPED